MDPLYTTYDLLQVVATQQSLPSFWRRFFPRMLLSEKDEIAIDRVSESYKRLAPFVAPNVQGRVSTKHGYTTVSFRPAYVKPKDIVDPNTDLIRQPGEAIGTGTLSLAQRRDIVIGQLLQGQRIKIDNRVEWMCAKAVMDGQVIVAGEDYPSVTVDFRRDPSLTIVLAGGAKWDTETSSPAADIMAARRAIKDKSGAVVNAVTFGPDAWDNFYAREIAGKETLVLSQILRTGSTDVSSMRDGFEGAEFMGRFRGSNGAGFECWVYTAKYEDDDGNMVDMMDPNRVVLAEPSGVQGVEAYGRIRDLKSNLGPQQYFPKMWQQEDPSLEYIMTQSAPLPIPGQPNASASIQTA